MTKPDLIARLRGQIASSEAYYEHAHIKPSPWFGMMTEAADEIERLRREHQLMLEALQADCTAFEGIEAKLIEVSNRISGNLGEPPCHPDPVMLSEWVAEINNAAFPLPENHHGR